MLKNRLLPFINRHEEINNLLMAPDITNDIKRMTDLSKEQSNMQPIVTKAREYIKLINDIDENKMMLDDPELGDLAKEELKELETRKPKLEDEIKFLMIPKDPNDDKNIYLELRAGTGDSDSFIRAVATSDSFTASGANAASLNYFSTSVAKLRSANAPTNGSGLYIAVITPQQELALAKELNGIQATPGAIGSLSDIGNQALRDALIGQAIGCQFLRSNNLPTGLASA